MTDRNLLLLTATITPKSGVPNLKRADPTQRLQDYAKALKFYAKQIHHSYDGIVFIENSNSNITSLESMVNSLGIKEKVEFIVFNGLDYPPHYDRGYGEFKLLDYGMSNSKLIAGSEDRETVIWKVTGRYIIQNIDKVIKNAPKNFDLYCNCRNYPKHWVDTYLMAWTPAGYEMCIRDIYPRLKTNVAGIPEGTAAEELFRSWLEQRFIRKNSNIVRRFRVTPSLEGIRGADNRNYSADDSWKFYARNMFQTLTPWLWL